MKHESVGHKVILCLPFVSTWEVGGENADLNEKVRTSFGPFSSAFLKNDSQYSAR